MQVWVVMLYSQEEGWDPGDVHESEESAYKEAAGYIESSIWSGRWQPEKKTSMCESFRAAFDEDKDNALYDWCQFDMDFDFAAYVTERETIPKNVEERLDEGLDGGSPGGDVSP